jgi:sugar phosphate isomerase/epimerase
MAMSFDHNLPSALAMAGLGIDAALLSNPAAHLRYVLTLARSLGCSALHLDATAPGLRARELDRSARRDIAASFRREGLSLSGLDLLIPTAQFQNTLTLQRAMDATLAAIALSSELAGLIDSSQRIVCLTLPRALHSDALQTLATQAQLHGVHLAIEWSSEASLAIHDPSPATHDASLSSVPSVGLMLDLATELLAGRQPHETIAKLGSTIACIRASDADRTGRVPIGRGRLSKELVVATIQTCTKLPGVVLDGAGLSLTDLRKL